MAHGHPHPGHARRPSPSTGRLATVGRWLRDHATLLRRLQWAVVLVYAALLVIPALLPLPDDSAHAEQPDHLRPVCVLGNLVAVCVAVDGVVWPHLVRRAVPGRRADRMGGAKAWAGRFRAGCAGAAGRLSPLC